MVGRLRDVVGDVEKEDAEREQDDDPDLHLLTGRAEEDGEEEDGREHARHDDVHDVERVTATQVDAEGDVGVTLARTTLVVELLARHVRRQDRPLAV